EESGWTMAQDKRDFSADLTLQAPSSSTMAQKKYKIIDGPLALDNARSIAFKGLTSSSGLVLALGTIYFCTRALHIVLASSSASVIQIWIHCLFFFVEVAFSS